MCKKHPEGCFLCVVHYHYYTGSVRAMSENLFIPKMDRGAPQVTADTSSVPPVPTPARNSPLLRSAQYLLIFLVGMLPLFFTPHLWASLGFSKTLLTIVVAAVTVVLVSFTALRYSHVQVITPWSLGVFWLFVFASILSGLFADSAQQAFRGSLLETQTVLFFVTMALVMMLPLVFQNAKAASLRLVAAFSVSATLVLVYNLLRVIFGERFLSFQSFNVKTVSPIGGFNDLAIFTGMIIVFCLVVLAQLPLRVWTQYFVMGTVVVSLFLLTLINLTSIWFLVGFFSILVLVYVMGREKLLRKNTEKPLAHATFLLSAAGLVLVTSALSVFASGQVGKLSSALDVNHVEVRPSAEATIDITKTVYQDHALLGIGPNTFSTAWRLHKDPAINETIFWDTSFQSGHSFVLTQFINLGLLGGILLVCFHVLFFYLGYRMLLWPKVHDTYWYYFGSSSFALASVVWIMTYFYVPGAAILLLGAFFTGCTYVAAAALLPDAVRAVPLVTNRQRGFFLMAVTIVVVVISVATVYSAGSQYIAEASFNKAQQQAPTRDVFRQVALSSYERYPDSRFMNTLAQIDLSELNALLSIPEPTDEDKQRFANITARAIQYAEQLVSEDSANPVNYAVLAGIYADLALVEIDGARDRAISALDKAMALDPQNPSYHLVAAQIAVRTGNVSLARVEIEKSLQLKRNYTDALYLSAQLDINDNNTKAAIATVRSIVALEPNNPTRYFQLGVLLASDTTQAAEAKQMFGLAIGLDPQYANARYMLALLYLQEEQTQLALEELRQVQQTNPENEQLAAFITQVESGYYEVPTSDAFVPPVQEIVPNEEEDGTVTTETDTDTSLVAPVNVISVPAAPRSTDEIVSPEADAE